MPHFQNLRLKKHKGLEKAELLNLGKINVLSGPNNSGKTTVLESIVTESLCRHGFQLSPRLVDQIHNRSRQGRHWNDSAYTKGYPKLLTVVSHSRLIWFAADEEEFASLFAEAWEKEFKGKFGDTGTGRLKKAYAEVFSQSNTVVLLPAKRQLETRKINNARDNIVPSGEGILNFLFNSKNQEESSLLYKQFSNISNAFQEVTGGYQFEVYQITDPRSQQSSTFVELRFRRSESSWIEAEACGLGLQEILIVLYFALASSNEIILVEEPENHLHPDIQRRLISYLRDNTDKQYFLSTHSSVFLNTQFADRVFTCRMTDSVQVENATSRAQALTELGYSIADNLVSDLVVLCEGPTDRPVLEEFFTKIGLSEKSTIKVWPMGGDIMDQLDLSVFQQNNQLIAIVDRDPGSTKVRKRFVEKCEELGIEVTHLKGRAIENYFSISAIASVMKGQMPDIITELDLKKPVKEQLGFEVKKNGGKIAKAMSIEDIKDTDLHEFLLKAEELISRA